MKQLPILVAVLLTSLAGCDNGGGDEDKQSPWMSSSSSSSSSWSAPEDPVAEMPSEQNVVAIATSQDNDLTGEYSLSQKIYYAYDTGPRFISASDTNAATLYLAGKAADAYAGTPSSEVSPAEILTGGLSSMPEGVVQTNGLALTVFPYGVALALSVEGETSEFISFCIAGDAQMAAICPEIEFDQANRVLRIENHRLDLFGLGETAAQLSIWISAEITWQPENSLAWIENEALQAPATGSAASLAELNGTWNLATDTDEKSMVVSGNIFSIYDDQADADGSGDNCFTLSQGSLVDLGEGLFQWTTDAPLSKKMYFHKEGDTLIGSDWSGVASQQAESEFTPLCEG